MERTPHWAEHFILPALERAFDKTTVWSKVFVSLGQQQEKEKEEKMKERKIIIKKNKKVNDPNNKIQN